MAAAAAVAVSMVVKECPLNVIIITMTVATMDFRLRSDVKGFSSYNFRREDWRTVRIAMADSLKAFSFGRTFVHRKTVMKMCVHLSLEQQEKTRTINRTRISCFMWHSPHSLSIDWLLHHFPFGGCGRTEGVVTSWSVVVGKSIILVTKFNPSKRCSRIRD